MGDQAPPEIKVGGHRPMRHPRFRHLWPYASVITYIRTKLRFALLRSTLAAIRGFRGKRSDVHLQDLMDIDFSLIPGPTVT